MSTDAKRRYASAAFITLLILSVFWPSPIVSSNHLWFGQDLSIDELSFLGREAPSWDVVFWCLAGLLALAIVQTGEFQRLRLERGPLPRPHWAIVLSGLAAVLLIWFVADQPALALAERIQSDTSRDVVRIVNRFGGGMNPPMIVIFFALAGAAYRKPEWVSHAMAMALAALSAGAVAHILKFAVGRTRPELWLGPFHHARGAANSFPSGHTVGAFAIAGVLLFASRSLPLRGVAMWLATAVGVSRILAFRHWTSDVVASALLGLLAAWVAARVGDVRVGGASSEPPLSPGPSLRSG
jgi:membrane-associated phospholipid phosphatase